MGCVCGGGTGEEFTPVHLSWPHQRHRAERGPATCLRPHSGRGGTGMQSRFCRITGLPAATQNKKYPWNQGPRATPCSPGAGETASDPEKPPLASPPLLFPPLASGLRGLRFPPGTSCRESPLRGHSEGPSRLRPRRSQPVSKPESCLCSSKPAKTPCGRPAGHLQSERRGLGAPLRGRWARSCSAAHLLCDFGQLRLLPGIQFCLLQREDGRGSGVPT